MLYFATGQVLHQTRDHKPTNPGEKKRIEAAGGKVVRGRVDGELALSRALGDFRYKRRDLISDPTKYKVDGRGADVEHLMIQSCTGQRRA